MNGFAIKYQMTQNKNDDNNVNNNTASTDTTPPEKDGKKSNLKGNLFLLLFSLVFGLVIAELAVRVYLRAGLKNIYQEVALQKAPNGSDFLLKDIITPSNNPKLVYELIPHREGRFQDVPYRSNSLGMRAPEIAKTKPADTWRIAALGDSTMFGWGVRREESYLAVLEEALNSAGDSRRFQVLNFAVPGYNTAIEADLYRSRVKDFSPDMVLIQFDINDLALPNFIQETPPLFTLKRLYLPQLISRLFKSREAGRGLEEMNGGLHDTPRIDAPTPRGMVKYFEYRAETAPPQYRYMVGWDGVKRALDRLWDGTSDETPIMHLSWFYSIQSGQLKDFGNTDRYALHILEGRKNHDSGKRLFFLNIMAVGREFCRKLGVKWSKALILNPPHDYHPSPARHALIARAIYLSLVNNRLLPTDSNHYTQKDRVAQALWDQAVNTLDSPPMN